MKAHYNETDISNCLVGFNIKKGETLFVHSNLGFFGRLSNSSGYEYTCSAWITALMDAVGPTGRVVIPTFTYSYARGVPYILNQLDSECGILSQYAFEQELGCRTFDPMYSVIIIGSDPEEVLSIDTDYSFGSKGIFSWLDKRSARFLNLNFDSASTYLHYLEKQFRVTYRFDKEFEGRRARNENDVLEEHTCTIFVAPKDQVDLQANFSQFHKIAMRDGFCKARKLGRGTVTSINTVACKDLLERYLPEYPYLLCNKSLDYNVEREVSL